MIALAFCIVSWALALWQCMNGHDVGGIILMASALLWNVLYLIDRHITVEDNIKTNYILKNAERSQNVQ